MPHTESTHYKENCQVTEFALILNESQIVLSKQMSQQQKTEKAKWQGAWVAQSCKASAFGSGCDPRVLGSSPASGSLLCWEPASSSPTPPPVFPLSLALCQINK